MEGAGLQLEQFGIQATILHQFLVASRLQHPAHR